MTPGEIHAVVWFIKAGEPEIVMKESFPCDRYYPVAFWANKVAEGIDGFKWLFDNIQVIKVEYWYGPYERG